MSLKVSANLNPQDDSAVKFVYAGLTPTNAFDYLTNTASAGYGTNFDEAVTNAGTLLVTGVPGVALDTNWLAQIQDAGGTGVILLEGCAATTKPLWLEIWRNGNLLGGVPLYLSINGEEQMFRHLNLSAYGNGSVEVASRADAPNEPATINKNLVFLHGYNVNQQQARGVQSEMFKRFYWSGSKAKFYGVTWNGAVSQGDIPLLQNISCNLQTNIVNALQTAPHLADFLINGLSGETTLVAHSLGNMVCLSAISDYGAPVDKYFMIDAAVAIEAIDGGVDNNSEMIHPDWADYTNQLNASEWHNLFPTNDARSTLTWRDRLSNLSSANAVYNFYSTNEEVLREFPGMPPDTFLSSIAAIASEWWDNTDTAAFVWVWQEKDKGRMVGNNFISSSHGGWQFNDISYGTNIATIGILYQHMSPNAAMQLTTSQLQTNSFFDFNSDNNGNTIHPDSALIGVDGSTYAQANRDRILSDVIPALTLPAGANLVPRLQVAGLNFNMQDKFQSGWPSARSAGNEALKWHHSDFDYVAYPYTHKLFNEIVNDGNLKSP